MLPIVYEPAKRIAKGNEKEIHFGTYKSIIFIICIIETLFSKNCTKDPNISPNSRRSIKKRKATKKAGKKSLNKYRCIIFIEILFL
jgi:hypothetical protein